MANLWGRADDDPLFHLDQFTPILASLPERPPWETSEKEK